MLEKVVSDLLSKYLGEYVENLAQDKLKIGIWKGDVSLSNLYLKKEALQALNLPITVERGFLGSLNIKVPWSSLKSDPVIAEISKVFILVSPRTFVPRTEEQEAEAQQKAKQDKLTRWELMKAQKEALSEGEPQQKSAAASSESGYVAQLTQTIVNNLQVIIKDVHIRYEDPSMEHGGPFAFGITLENISAQSTNGKWEPSFVKDAKDFLYKRVELGGFSVYLDKSRTDDLFSKLTMSKEDFERRMQYLIRPLPSAPQHEYLLQPVTGYLHMKTQVEGSNNMSVPRRFIDTKFTKIGLVVRDDQYRSILHTLDFFSNFEKLEKFRSKRPLERPTKDPKGWWLYAGRCVLSTVRDRRQRLSWTYVLQRRKLRQEYLPLYKRSTGAPWLAPLEEEGRVRLTELERTLTYDDIVFFRTLASAELKLESLKHAVVEASKREKKALEKKQQQQTSGGGMFSSFFGRKTAAPIVPAATGVATEEPQAPQPVIEITEEERKKIFEQIGLSEIGEHSASSASAVALPPDYVVSVMKFELEEGSITFADSSMMCNIAQVALKKALVSIDSLPSSMKVVSMLQSFVVEDCINAHTSQFTHIVSSKRQQLPSAFTSAASALGGGDGLLGGNLLRVEYDSCPLDGRADSAVKVIMDPLDVYVNPVFVQRLLSFFVIPSGLDLALVEQALDRRIASLKTAAQERLRTVISNKKTMDIYVDIAAPNFIVPEDCTQKHTPMLRVDLGHLIIRSELDSGRKERAKIGSGSLNLDDFYDKFSMKMDRIQVFLAQQTDMGRTQYMFPAKLVEEVEFGMSLQQSILPDNQDIPVMKLNAKIPTIKLNMSTSQYELLLRTINVVLELAKDPHGGFSPADVRTSEGVEMRGPYEILPSNEESLTAAAPSTVRDLKTSVENERKKANEWSKKWIVVRKDCVMVYESSSLVQPLAVINLKGSEKVTMRTTPTDAMTTASVTLQHKSGGTTISGPRKVFSLDLPIPKSDKVQRFEFALDRSDKRAKLADGITAAIMHVQAEEQKAMRASSSADLMAAVSSQHLPSATELEKEKEAAKISKTQIKLEGEFVLDKFSLSLMRPPASGTQEVEFMELRATTLSVSISTRAFDMQVGAKLQAIEVIDKCKTQQKEAPTSVRDLKERYLLTSKSRYQTPKSTEPFSSSPEDQEGLVAITYIATQQESPIFDATTASLISAKFQTLKVHFDRDSVSFLLEFLFEFGMAGKRVEERQGGGTKGSIQVYEALSDKVESAEAVSVSEEVSSVVDANSSQKRLSMKITAEMRELKLVLLQNGTDRFASLSVENAKLGIEMAATHMDITGQLGNVNLHAHQLPDPRYEHVLGLARSQDSSFIDFVYHSESAPPPPPPPKKGAKQPVVNTLLPPQPKYTSSFSAKMSSLRVVYLARFFTEIQYYFTEGPIMEVIKKAGQKASQMASAAVQNVQKRTLELIHLDLGLSAPLVIVPQRCDSDLVLKANLGRIELKNEIHHQGEPLHLSCVWFDTFKIRLTEMSLASANWKRMSEREEKEEKREIVRKMDLGIDLDRAVINPDNAVPGIKLSVNISDIVLDLSDAQYRLIMSVINHNILDSYGSQPQEATTVKPSGDEPASPTTELDPKYLAPSAERKLLEETSQKTAQKTFVTTEVTVRLPKVELQTHRRDGSGPTDPLGQFFMQQLNVSFAAFSDGSNRVDTSLENVMLIDKRTDSTSKFTEIFNSNPTSELVKSPTSPTPKTLSTTTAPTATRCLLVSYQKEACGDFSVSLSLSNPSITFVPDFAFEVQNFFVDGLAGLPLPTTEKDAQKETLSEIQLKERESAVSLETPKAPVLFGDVHISSDTVLTEDLFLNKDRRLFVSSAAGKGPVAIDGQSKFSINFVTSPSCPEGEKHPPLVFVKPDVSLRFSNVTLRSFAIGDVSELILADNASVVASSRQGVKRERLEKYSDFGLIAPQTVFKDTQQQSTQPRFASASATTGGAETLSINEVEQSVFKDTQKDVYGIPGVTAGRVRAVAVAQQQTISQKIKKTAKMTIKADFGRPRIVLPENAATRGCRLLVLEVGGRARFESDGVTELGDFSLSGVSVSVLVDGSDQERLDIVEPIVATVDLAGKKSVDVLGAVVTKREISVLLNEIFARVSYQDIKMFQIILANITSGMSAATDGSSAGDEAKKKGAQTNDQESLSVLEDTQMDTPRATTAAAGFESNLTPPVDAPKNVMEIRVATRTTKVLLVDDCRGYDIPLLVAALPKLAASLNSGPDLMNLGVEFELKMDYYNLRVAAWEPVVESWGGSFQMTTQSTGVQAHPTSTKLALSTPTVLNVNVTHAMVDTFISTSKLWSEGLYHSAVLAPSSRFQPYVLRNQSGVDLKFWVLSKKDEVIDVPAGAEVGFEFPSSKKAENQAGLHSYITLKFDGYWGTLPNIPVHKVGRSVAMLRSAQPPKTYAAREPFPMDNILKIEVELSEGHKVVTLRSPYKVVNDTTVPLLLRIQSPDSSILELGELKPKSTIGLPVTKLNGSLLIKPHSDSSEFMWNSPIEVPLKNLVPSEKLLTCKNGKSFGGALHWHCVLEIECKAFGLNENPVKRDFVMRLKPPLAFENLMACPLTFAIGEKSGASWDPSRQIASGTLSRGEKVFIYSANLTKPLQAVAQLGEKWKSISPPALIHANEAGEKLGDKLVIQDVGGAPLTLFLNYGLDGREAAREVCVYCPYWIVNHTGLNLFVRNDGKKLAAGQDEKGTPKDAPLMLSFSSWEPFGNKISVSVADSAFSSGFDIDNVGTSGLISVMNERNNRRYDLGVDMKLAPGKFNRTKVITITARFVLLNKTQHKMLIRQSGGVISAPPPSGVGVSGGVSSAPSGVSEFGESGDFVFLSDEERKNFYWTDARRPQLVQIKLLDSPFEWSLPFSMDTIGDLDVKVRNPLNNDFYIVRVQIRQQQSSAFVVFEKDSERAPYVIDNKTWHTVTVNQEGLVDIWAIDRHKQLRYAWDDPLGKHRLTVSVGGVKETVSLDELKEKKRVSFKDERGQVVKVYMRVLANGPTRTLLLSDTAPKKKDDDETESIRSDSEDVVTFAIEAKISGLGLSIIDQTPRELLYFFVDRTDVKYTVTPIDTRIEAKISSIQIDNQLYSALMPVLFSPHKREAERPFLHISIFKSNEDQSVDFYKYFSVLLQEADLTVDDTTLLQLWAFISSFGANLTTSITGGENKVDRLMAEVDAPNLEADGVKKMYFDLLQLHPIKVNLTLLSDSAAAPSLHNPVLVLLNTLGVALKNIDNVPLRLNALILEHPFVTRSMLTSIVTKHYTRQALTEFYKVLGSMEFLGNPVGLVNNLGTGVFDFFYEPAMGITKSPEDFGLGLAKGTLSLLKNSVYGAFNAASSITGSISKGVATLSLDDDYLRERQIESREKPKHAADGLFEGAKSLTKGIFLGVTGIVTKPIEGAQKDGVAGFFEGLGKGIVGVAVKPITGGLDLVTKTTEGIRNTATYFDREERKRVRPPRTLHEDVLKAYSLSDAYGQNLLVQMKGGKYAQDKHKYNCAIGRSLLLLTENRVMLVNPANGAREWGIKLWKLDSIQTPDNKSVVFQLRPEAQKKGLFSSKDVMKIVVDDENKVREIKQHLAMAIASLR